MSVDPPSLPRRRPLTLVLTHLLAAVVAVLAVFMAVTSLAPPSLSREVVLLCVLFGSAPLLGALAWSVQAQWSDRVELWADRLVRWQRGEMESFALADVARLDARLSGMRAGVDLETPVGLRVVMADGRVLAIDGLPLRRARPVMQLVGAVVLERWYATLRQGGAVVCADAPPFPWVLVGFGSLLLGAASYVFYWRGQDALVTLLRAALLLGSTATLAAKALRTWWAARRTGGVEMSAAGIRPLRASAPRAESLAPSPYRAVTTPTREWTPWSAVGDVYIDGFGLWVHCANRPDSLVLSGRTENFFVVNEFVAAMRSTRIVRPPQD